MSPEQIRCGALDQRADVYSFGCLLYELVAGAPPFTGSTQEELFGKHLKSAVPPLEAADGNVTADFANLVRRCLAKDPAARPVGPESPGRVPQDADVPGFPASFRPRRVIRFRAEKADDL